MRELAKTITDTWSPYAIASHYDLAVPGPIIEVEYPGGGLTITRGDSWWSITGCCLTDAHIAHTVTTRGELMATLDACIAPPSEKNRPRAIMTVALDKTDMRGLSSTIVITENRPDAVEMLINGTRIRVAEMDGGIGVTASPAWRPLDQSPTAWSPGAPDAIQRTVTAIRDAIYADISDEAMLP